MNGGDSYEEYLAKVSAQDARDRQRFTGTYEGDKTVVYDMRDGRSVDLSTDADEYRLVVDLLQSVPGWPPATAAPSVPSRYFFTHPALNHPVDFAAMNVAIQVVAEALTKACAAAAEEFHKFYEANRAFFDALMSEQEILNGDGSHHQPVGVLSVGSTGHSRQRRGRHSYPRKHGQWWLQR